MSAKKRPVAPKPPPKGARPGGRGGWLRTGNPGNKGGRAREDFVAHCQKLVKTKHVAETLAHIVNGDILELIGHDQETGKPIYGETKNADRIRASDLLLAYAFGRPTQPLAGEGMEPIKAHIVVEYD